jgi:hypothetical protein
MMWSTIPTTHPSYTISSDTSGILSTEVLIRIPPKHYEIGCAAPSTIFLQITYYWEKENQYVKTYEDAIIKWDTTTWSERNFPENSHMIMAKFVGNDWRI